MPYHTIECDVLADAGPNLNHLWQGHEVVAVECEYELTPLGEIELDNITVRDVSGLGLALLRVPPEVATHFYQWAYQLDRFEMCELLEKEYDSCG